MVPGAPRHVTYTAPELGYPAHPCRVCGRRPAAVRLTWYPADHPRTGGYIPHRAFFCAEHLADANRAHRALAAGAVPPELARGTPPRRRRP
jgi:hypothetical protein